MAGFHCTDCIYSSFSMNEHSNRYQGACSRGYTLAVPHVYKKPDMFFADDPRDLVPVVNPYGKEYLRTSNVCRDFTTPVDKKRADAKAKRGRSKGPASNGPEQDAAGK